jgi:hypothetical protein
MPYFLPNTQLEDQQRDFAAKDAYAQQQAQLQARQDAGLAKAQNEQAMQAQNAYKQEVASYLPNIDYDQARTSGVYDVLGALKQGKNPQMVTQIANAKGMDAQYIAPNPDGSLTIAHNNGQIEQVPKAKIDALLALHQQHGQEYNQNIKDLEDQVKSGGAQVVGANDTVPVGYEVKTIGGKSYAYEPKGMKTQDYMLARQQANEDQRAKVAQQKITDQDDADKTKLAGMFGTNTFDPPKTSIDSKQLYADAEAKNMQIVPGRNKWTMIPKGIAPEDALKGKDISAQMQYAQTGKQYQDSGIADLVNGYHIGLDPASVIAKAKEKGLNITDYGKMSDGSFYYTTKQPDGSNYNHVVSQNTEQDILTHAQGGKVGVMRMPKTTQVKPDNSIKEDNKEAMSALEDANFSKDTIYADENKGIPNGGNVNDYLIAYHKIKATENSKPQSAVNPQQPKTPQDIANEAMQMAGLYRPDDLKKVLSTMIEQQKKVLEPQGSIPGFKSYPLMPQGSNLTLEEDKMAKLQAAFKSAGNGEIVDKRTLSSLGVLSLNKTAPQQQAQAQPSQNPHEHALDIMNRLPLDNPIRVAYEQHKSQSASNNAPQAQARPDVQSAPTEEQVQSQTQAVAPEKAVPTMQPSQIQLRKTTVSPAALNMQSKQRTVYKELGSMNPDSYEYDAKALELSKRLGLSYQQVQEMMSKLKGE